MCSGECTCKCVRLGVQQHVCVCVCVHAPVAVLVRILCVGGRMLKYKRICQNGFRLFMHVQYLAFWGFLSKVVDILGRHVDMYTAFCDIQSILHFHKHSRMRQAMYLDLRWWTHMSMSVKVHKLLINRCLNMFN